MNVFYVLQDPSPFVLYTYVDVTTYESVSDSLSHR